MANKRKMFDECAGDILTAINVTSCGNIQREYIDDVAGDYIVWDETSTTVICKSPYEPIARKALEWYAKEILG